MTAKPPRLELVTPPAANEPIPSPENTPIPGSGSWTWDHAAQRWAPYPLPALEPARSPAEEPAQE